MNRRKYLGAMLVGGLLTIGFGANAQKDGVAIDVQDYRIDCELVPASQLLRAKTEVTFVPASDTRSVVFEMNGSLAIKRIVLKSSAMAPPPPPAPEPSATTKSPSRGGKPSQSAKESKAAKDLTVSQTPELQFIQDSRENLNVRVDLGGVVPAGKPVVLTFEYEGALESPQGGPLQNARLAFVGEQGSYLFYAADRKSVV